MKKEKTILYCGINSTPEERAEIIYNHPDNKEKPLRIQEKIIEYIPISSRDENKNPFQSNLSIMPISPDCSEYIKPKYSKDLKQERKERANEIRLQQRNTYPQIKINPKEKIDYINKPQNATKPIISSSGFSFGLNPDNSSESEIKMDSKIKLKPKNYDEIAEAFYPDMEEKSQISKKHKYKYNNSAEIQQSSKAFSNEKNYGISNVEQTLFSEGIMGEIPLKPLYGNEKVYKSQRNKTTVINKTAKDYEEIANVMYPNMPDSPKIKLLKEIAIQEEADNEAEYVRKLNQYRIGAAIELASAAIPGFGEAGLAKTIVQGVTPALGRTLAKQAVTGAMRGASSGAVFGLGEGLLNDENPLITTAEGTVAGAVSGSIFGVAAGKYLQGKRAKQLADLADKRADWGITYRQYSGKPEEAIDFLMKEQKGFVPSAMYKKGIGNIDFVWGDSNAGLKHIIERRNSQGYDGAAFVKKIPSIIRNGKVLEREEHIGRKYITDDTCEAVVRLDWNQKERKWLITTYIINKNI